MATITAFNYRKAKLEEVADLAKYLMAKHLSDPEYKGWRFAWNNSLKFLGVCCYRDEQVLLSIKWSANLPIEEVEDTILHEIAHVLTEGDSHGELWKAACRRLGANPERLAKPSISIRDIAMPTHLLLDAQNNIIKKYYRAPTANTYRKLANLYVTGRKDETWGKLRIESTSLETLPKL